METYAVPKGPALCDTCHEIYLDAVSYLSVAGEALLPADRIPARSLGGSINKQLPVCYLCPLLRDGSDGGQLFCLEVHGLAFKTSIFTQWILDRRGNPALLPFDGSRQSGSKFGWSIHPRPKKLEGCGGGCRCAYFDGVNWDTLKGWVRTCAECHQSCGELSETTSKTNTLRVIDCDTRKLVTLDSPSQRYVSLSYVWGKHTPTSTDEQIQQTGILGSLPPLIEDALHATKALGLRYLWIDRYCIHQNNVAEKHALIRNMGHIYANSYLTLITSCSDNPSQGINGVSESRTNRTLVLGQHHVTVSKFTVAKEIAGSYWNTRGWTYQELLLARRRLVFTKTQAYFQCYEMHRFETLGELAPRELDSRLTLFSSVLPEEGIGKSFHNICERIMEYIKRHLSYEMDRADAFQGILQVFSDRYNIVSLSGLPIFPTGHDIPETLQDHSRLMEGNVNNLVASLDWNFTGAVTPVRNQHLPSWSWVGWRFLGDVKSFGLPSFSKDPSSIVFGYLIRGYDFHKTLCLASCAKVKFEFNDGIQFSWVSGKNQLLAYQREGSKWPKFLLVRSWVAAVHLLREVPIFESGNDSGEWGDSDSDIVGEDKRNYQTQLRSHRVYLGRTGQGGGSRFGTNVGIDEMTGFARAVDPKQRGAYQQKTCPELLAIVMSAKETVLIALIVTPKLGTDYFEFCGVRRFVMQQEGDCKGSMDDLEDNLGLSQSPFPEVDDGQLPNAKVFEHHGIDFELRDIKIG